MANRTMTRYERVMAALELREPDQVPIVENWNHFAFRHAGYTHSECLLDGQKLIEAQVKALRDFGGDAVWGPNSSGFVAEACGGNLIMTPDDPTVPGEPIIGGMEDVEALDVHGILDKGRIPQVLDTIRRLRRAVGDEVPIFSVASSPPMTASWLRDTQVLYKDFIKRPELAEALIARCVAPAIEFARALVEAGVDVVWVPDPSFSKTCISRRHYARFAYPYTKQFFTALRDQGIKVVYHVCGDWNDRMDLAVEGPTGLHLSAEADLAAVKSSYGQSVALMGNIKSVAFLYGTADELEQETRRCLDEGARGGGFILSGDCSIPPASPAENVAAVVRAARGGEF